LGERFRSVTIADGSGQLKCGLVQFSPPVCAFGIVAVLKEAVTDQPISDEIAERVAG
jgi:hypothetical protein